MDRPIVRHLDSLTADIIAELRTALDYIVAAKIKDDTLVRVEMKIRNAMELLTGSRD